MRGMICILFADACTLGPPRGPPGALSREGRQRGLLSLAGLALFGQNRGREREFLSKSDPECFWFLLLGAGRVPAPEREKREVSFPDIAPNPLAILPRLPRSVWTSVFAPRARARPEPRTTHNSAHSRLSFLQNLLPEETPEMAGVERGWGSESGEATCLKAPMAGFADHEGLWGIHRGVQLCQRGAVFGPEQSVSVLLQRALLCLSADSAPLRGRGVCGTEAISLHHRYLPTQGPQKLRLLGPKCIPSLHPDPSLWVNLPTLVLTPKPKGWPRGGRLPEGMWTSLGSPAGMPRVARFWAGTLRN